MAITPFTIIGVRALSKSFSAYRARRRDPSLPQDPATDRWWRVLISASTVIAIDSLLIVGASAANAGREVGLALFILLIPAVALAFAAAFMLGWRS
jgi:hypothetical protein